jgi:hypothetical protein
MLTPDQINELHRLHLVEKWSLRKISRHLRIGRHTLAKYLRAPAAKPARRDRASKLDPFKTAIAELLQQDPTANAPPTGSHYRVTSARSISRNRRIKMQKKIAKVSPCRVRSPHAGIRGGDEADGPSRRPRSAPAEGR